MKRLLTLLSLLLCIVSVQAQETESLYTFKGIPIEGATDDFIKQLVEQGFKVEKNDYSLENFSEQCLYGTFFNRDVMLLLSEKSSNIINAVFVLFVSDNIESTISIYKSVRDGLNSKYGNSPEWLFADIKSIDGKSLIDIKYDLVVKGETYGLGIVLKEQDTTIPYIALSLTKDVTTIVYSNPNNYNPSSFYNDL